VGPLTREEVSQLDPNGLLDFQDPTDIRIKGHRHGIEEVLLALREGWSVAKIARRYPTLTLDEIAGVIEIYQSAPSRFDSYLDAVIAHEEKAREEQRLRPNPLVRRLMELKAARAAAAKQ
jgi:uncharacterized protein (DUF433 family)